MCERAIRRNPHWGLEIVFQLSFLCNTSNAWSESSRRLCRR